METNDIVNRALDAFNQLTQIKAVWKPARLKKDGTVDFYFDKRKPQRYLVEIKKEIRNQHLPKLLQHRDKAIPILVIAENILPKTKVALQNHNIGYLETNGNIYLKRLPHHFIWIENQKPKAVTKEVNRAFTKTGLKIRANFSEAPEIIKSSIKPQKKAK